jgi:hypothetical protein
VNFKGRDLRRCGERVALPAGPGLRIKSPLLCYRISALSVSLCRFVRDFAGFAVGLCRRVTARIATYEHPPSTHRSACTIIVECRSWHTDPVRNSKDLMASGPGRRSLVERDRDLRLLYWLRGTPGIVRRARALHWRVRSENPSALRQRSPGAGQR